MKFEGNYPAEPKEAPRWFGDFHKNFSLVIKFLNGAGKRGLNLNDNILNKTFTASVSHGRPFRFQHNLGVNPVVITPQGGRYFSYVNNSGDKDANILTFYLMSSPVSSTTSYATIDFVDVLDSTIFKVTDYVSITNQIRKITNINENRITLDSAIRLTLPAVVTLYSESITVVFL
jgi:hypothetical protein